MPLVYKGLNNPRRGFRSIRELVVLPLAGSLLGLLVAAAKIGGASTAALLIVVGAVMLAAVAGGWWWQYRGRERFPLRSVDEIS